MFMRKYILADNQELTCYALQCLLKQDKQNAVYRTTNQMGLIQLLKEHEDSVVLLDYTLFDFPDEDSLLIVGERFTMATWVLISDDLTKKFLQRVVYSSHAFSVVFKGEPQKAVWNAIMAASESKRYISQRAMEVIIAHKHEDNMPNVLTSTEIEIVKAIAQGKTTKDIANERVSSIHTINTHRKNIFRKLGINTAHEAIKYALRAGWVDASDFYI